MTTSGPACATCRQKCRRCDRAQPACRRCASKGLQCGGYPPKFKFCGIASRGKWKGEELPVPRRRPQPSTQSTRSQRIRARAAAGVTGTAMSESCAEDPITGRGLIGADYSSTLCDVESTYLLEDDPNRPFIEVEELLISEHTENLLSYYDKSVCPHLIAEGPESAINPFREFILPMAYEHVGLLHALLGLTTCHMGAARKDKKLYETEALKHRLEAIRFLSALLWNERNGSLQDPEHDVLLAIILILVLHDVCDSGISSHGAHLTGAKFVCERVMAKAKVNGDNRCTVFLLGALAWLDLLRGFSGAEKLCFSQGMRQAIVDASDFGFEVVNGCPREIFLMIGDVVSKAKDHLSGELSLEAFEVALTASELQLRDWNKDREIYPSQDPHWKLLAEAFRHACILRALRFHDPWKPAEFSEIQRSVAGVLDASSGIPPSSLLSKRLLLPLFMAGADSLSPHSRHYLLIRINEIRDQTSFRNPAATDLLERVWAARAAQAKCDTSNVPWMEFVSHRSFVVVGDPKLKVSRPAVKVLSDSMITLSSEEKG